MSDEAIESIIETIRTKTNDVETDDFSQITPGLILSGKTRAREKENFVKRINYHLTYLESSSPYSPSAEKIKIVIVGDGGCGKTYSIQAFMHGRDFVRSYVPTVLKVYRTSCENTELEIRDAAGQGDYDRVRKLSYPDLHLAVISFSIGDNDTLDDVSENVSPNICLK